MVATRNTNNNTNNTNNTTNSRTSSRSTVNSIISANPSLQGRAIATPRATSRAILSTISTNRSSNTANATRTGNATTANTSSATGTRARTSAASASSVNATNAPTIRASAIGFNTRLTASGFSSAAIARPTGLRPTLTGLLATVAARTARLATTVTADTARATRTPTGAGTLRTIRTATGATIVRRRIVKKRTNTEKNRDKKLRRKLRKLPPSPRSTKRVKLDDEFNEDVFKYISPISFIQSIDSKLRPEKYPRFIYKNQRKANTWSCQLQFLRKRWASDNKVGKQAAKNDVCQKAVMELYKDNPELCIDVRNQLFNLSDQKTDALVTSLKPDDLND